MEPGAKHRGKFERLKQVKERENPPGTHVLVGRRGVSQLEEEQAWQ